MPRKSKGPWWWERRGQWVVDIKGKRHYLGTDQEEAQRQWHEIMSAPPGKTPVVESGSLVVLLDDFLQWVSLHRPASLEWYTQRISEFARTVSCGEKLIDLVLGEL